MHILFLTDNFPPEVNAPASRTYEHCREWVKAGAEVTVVTCAPNFPKGALFDGYRNRLWQTEEMDGIRVVRVWSYISANEGFLRRTLDYVSYMVSATLAAPFVRKADIVIGTSPQFFTAVAAYMVSRTKRIPFVFELRDLWPESIQAVGALKPSRALRALSRLEMFLYRKAAAIVSVTRSFREILMDRGVDGAKIHVVTNGSDLTRFHPLERDAALARELGVEGRFVAGYIGTHGMAHALHSLLEAARLLAGRPDGRDIVLLLVGDGAEKKALKARAEELGLANVRFVDTVPKAEIPRYWSLLDVSIIHLRKQDLFKSVIPSKMFESMAMGIPILHGVEGESADILRESGAGFTFEPENAAELADHLVRLAGDTALRAEAGRRGIAAARRYDRRQLAAEMLDVLRRLVPAARRDSA
ncbi:MAG: glycosyltransferase family 4 protein [Allosphingosinicella sp.]|uniref:glycosyltransferase family 4 protein n=1 Tax=Allosphingosinicella sp. TaxID=2823234 RepID=UPI0039494F43